MSDDVWDVDASFGTVELPDIVKYAGASGDFNPIHYHDTCARQQGYRTNFAQGMLLMGWAGATLAAAHPDRDVRRFGCRFVDQLFCGDTMRLQAATGTSGDGSGTWTVFAEHADSGERRIAASGWIDLAPAPRRSTGS